MRTIKAKVYQFTELSDSAKQNAMDWYRGCSNNDFSEVVIEDAKEIASLFGLNIKKVYWSGFSSQGDGACFDGNYSYEKGALKAVMEYAPLDLTLHSIVKGLQHAQRKLFYKLNAKCIQSGHYAHSNSMNVAVEYSDDQYRDIGEAESGITELLRDFANWIYTQLEKEFDYQNSDEVVEESITANEYEFTMNGERAV